MAFASIVFSTFLFVVVTEQSSGILTVMELLIMSTIDIVIKIKMSLLLSVSVVNKTAFFFVCSNACRLLSTYLSVILLKIIFNN